MTEIKDSPQVNQYLAFIETTAQWFKSRANRFHWFYNVSRTLIIALSLTVPLLSTEVTSLPSLAKWVLPVVTTVIAILAALDGLFKPGEMWRHFRFHQLALLRLLRTYRADLAALEATPGSTEYGLKANELFASLVADTEKILEEESASFWPQRIQPLEKH